MQEFYEELLENDLNPFMLFDSSGKLIKYNKEAEFLLSYVSSRQMYDLAVANAPLSFGFKRTFVSLHYERNTFYAVLVGYQDEDRLGIKLYKEVSDSAKQQLGSTLTEVNVFTLLALSKNSTLANSPVIINELFDPSIPDVQLPVDKFLSLLNSAMRIYEKAEELSISVFLKIGETMLIEGVKYPICSIKFHSYDTKIQDVNSLYRKAKEAGVSLFVKETTIMIEFPLMV